MSSLFFSVFFYAVLFGILYGIIALLVGVILGKKYEDDWMTSKAIQIFDGSCNIGLAIVLLNEDGRAWITTFLIDLMDMDQDAAKGLYISMLFIGALSLVIGIATICWALFEAASGRQNVAPRSAPASPTRPRPAVSDDVVCSSCGTKVSEDYRLCPNCGHNVDLDRKAWAAKEKSSAQAIYCSECGEKMMVGEKRCKKCGTWNLDNL